MKVIAFYCMKIIAILLVTNGVIFFIGTFIGYWRDGDLHASSIRFLISIVSLVPGFLISKFAESIKIKNAVSCNHEETFSSKKPIEKSEIKKKAQEMLSYGNSKTEVFESLSSGGRTDGYLANIIASYANHYTLSLHAKKINIAINIMFLQAVLSFISGFNIGQKFTFVGKLAIAIFCMSIPLLFAWGFYKNKAGFYNAYIILTIIQFPRSLQGIHAEPLALVGLVLNLLMLAYIWYVRSKLFPDFVFIMPKKEKGKYVFGS